jgi:chromosomal replication initiator protein
VPQGAAGEILYLGAPTPIREWVRRRYGRALDSAVAAAHPSLARVELVAGPGCGGAAAAPRPARRTINAAHSFDQFVIGAANRFAHAAALAAAEMPGNAYNPLFIYGPGGVGKTHLLQAVGNYVLTHDPTADIVYATVDTFTTDFTGSLRRRETSAFKDAYRRADVLLLDEVQLLEDRPKTAEEFFHTFDELHSGARQIVLAADRSPGAMPNLHAQLRDRFAGGLVVEVDPPGFDTRLAILRKRTAPGEGEHGYDQTLEFLAHRVPSNVRSLEGAFIRARAYASLTQQDLTPDLAQRVISTLDNDPHGVPTSVGSSPTVEQIQAVAAGALDILPADLSSRKRNRRVVYARRVAMYLCRELTPLSLPAIAQRFGGRDHTTVLHAHKRMKQDLLADQDARRLVDNLLTSLRSPTSP